MEDMKYGDYVIIDPAGCGRGDTICVGWDKAVGDAALYPFQTFLAGRWLNNHNWQYEESSKYHCAKQAKAQIYVIMLREKVFFCNIK